MTASGAGDAVPAREDPLMSIGEVLAHLRGEFPDDARLARRIARYVRPTS